MRRQTLLFVLPLVFTAGLAAAGPATPEGAAALTGQLQTYLGTVPGVVSVAPAGDSYGVTLDFAPLLAKLPGEGVAATISPIVFNLTDNGDGTWAMTEDQPLQLSVKVPGQIDFDLRVGNLTSSGVFDAALGTFSQSTSALTDITLAETVPDPALGETHLVYKIASASYDSRAVANATAGADLTSTYSMLKVSEDFSVPGQNGAAPVAISAKVARYDGDASVTAMRPEAIYKLVAFLVANPESVAIAAHQDELKAIIKAGLPLFEHLTSSAKMSDLGVESPIGHVGLDEVAMQIEANGLVPEGLVREAFILSGPNLPKGLVPEWATGLVPQSLGVDFSLRGYDLAAPFALLLDSIDLTKPEPIPSSLDATLLQKLLPAGTVTFSLAPTGVTAPLYTLNYEGSLTFGPAVAPTGKALVSLTGMQAIRDAVKSAPVDPGARIALMLGAAEGAAKREAGGVLSWDLEMTANQILVNGVNFSQLGGGE